MGCKHSRCSRKEQLLFLLIYTRQRSVPNSTSSAEDSCVWRGAREVAQACSGRLLHSGGSCPQYCMEKLGGNRLILQQKQLKSDICQLEIGALRPPHPGWYPQGRHLCNLGLAPMTVRMQGGRWHQMLPKAADRQGMNVWMAFDEYGNGKRAAMGNQNHSAGETLERLLQTCHLVMKKGNALEMFTSSWCVCRYACICKYIHEYVYVHLV